METLANVFPNELSILLDQLKDPEKSMFLQMQSKGTASHCYWKDYRVPIMFNADNIEFAREQWDIPENSIFITSFPKTGTNWTAEIVRQILYGRDSELDKVSKLLPMPLFVTESGPVSKFDLIKHIPLPRKFFVSHICQEMFNYQKMKQKRGKMIYIIRNPKDQAVSWYHFAKKLPVPEHLKKLLGTDDWSTFIENYCRGDHPNMTKPGDWYPDHIRGWLKHQDDEDFLLLVYEDMKKDLVGQINRIAQFLEVDLAKEEALDIADKCSVNSMRKAFENDSVRKHVVRKGEIGGWKEYFTVAQSEMMDRKFNERFKDTGVQFTFESPKDATFN